MPLFILPKPLYIISDLPSFLFQLALVNKFSFDKFVFPEDLVKCSTFPEENGNADDQDDETDDGNVDNYFNENEFQWSVFWRDDWNNILDNILSEVGKSIGFSDVCLWGGNVFNHFFLNHFLRLFCLISYCSFIILDIHLCLIITLHIFSSKPDSFFLPIKRHNIL